MYNATTRRELLQSFARPYQRGLNVGLDEIAGNSPQPQSPIAYDPLLGGRPITRTELLRGEDGRSSALVIGALGALALGIAGALALRGGGRRSPASLEGTIDGTILSKDDKLGKYLVQIKNSYNPNLGLIAGKEYEMRVDESVMNEHSMRLNNDCGVSGYLGAARYVCDFTGRIRKTNKGLLITNISSLQQRTTTVIDKPVDNIKTWWKRRQKR